MGEAHVEFTGLRILGGDRRGQLVLLVLQHERKAKLVPQILEVELGDHLARDPVVKPILGRDESERDDLLRNAEIVEQVERGRMKRSRALVGDRRGLLLEHGDRNAPFAERECADHSDRTGADDDDVLRARSGHPPPALFSRA
jgi:hypothetical protein